MILLPWTGVLHNNQGLSCLSRSLYIVFIVLFSLVCCRLYLNADLSNRRILFLWRNEPTVSVAVKPLSTKNFVFLFMNSVLVYLYFVMWGGQMQILVSYLFLFSCFSDCNRKAPGLFPDYWSFQCVTLFNKCYILDLHWSIFWLIHLESMVWMQFKES